MRGCRCEGARYRALATAAVARCGGGVEPLRPTDENTNAATNRTAVAARRRFGVSHPMWWLWSHDRTPLAPAIAAITQPAHMA
jgi:hypothetical protein